MDFKLTIDQSSLRKVLQNIKKLSAKTVRAAESALYVKAEDTMFKSKLQCPVDTGALRSTGFVYMPRTGSARLSAILSYGGPAGAGGTVTPGTSPTTGRKAPNEVGYATQVHEGLLYFHKVGKPLFLSDPLKAAIPGLTRDLGRFIKSEVGY